MSDLQREYLAVKKQLAIHIQKCNEYMKLIEQLKQQLPDTWFNNKTFSNAEQQRSIEQSYVFDYVEQEQLLRHKLQRLHGATEISNRFQSVKLD